MRGTSDYESAAIFLRVAATFACNFERAPQLPLPYEHSFRHAEIDCTEHRRSTSTSMIKEMPKTMTIEVKTD